MWADLTFSWETAISFTFDCLSVLTRVSEIYFFTFFRLFSDLVFYLKSSVEYLSWILYRYLYLEFIVETIHLEVSVCDYVQVSVAVNPGGKRLRDCREISPFPRIRPLLGE